MLPSCNTGSLHVPGVPTFTELFLSLNMCLQDRSLPFSSKLVRYKTVRPDFEFTHQIKDDKIRGTCTIHGREERCVRSFREETQGKTNLSADGMTILK